MLIQPVLALNWSITNDRCLCKRINEIMTLRKSKKVFFFGKKKQKTFTLKWPGEGNAETIYRVPQLTKFFC